MIKSPMPGGSGVDHDTLAPDEVRYLSFEGGGGKGNAYLGALKALSSNTNVLENVEGISGASAGAITALLVGAGYKYRHIKQIMEQTDFKTFFEEPNNKTIRLRFNHDNHSWELSYKHTSTSLNVGASDLIPAFLIGVEDAVSSLLKGTASLRIPLVSAVSGLHKTLYAKLWYSFFYSLVDKKYLAKQLTDDKADYFGSLVVEHGLFSGHKIHKWLNNIILKKLLYDKGEYSDSLGKSMPNFTGNKKNYLEKVSKYPTFRELYNKDGTAKFFRNSSNLKFTSVNLRTGQVHILSRKTTPDLPIATAARMSMSLPFIYKPVRIEKGSPMRGPNLNGVWLDGGVINNAPINVFGDSDHTLLFRLGDRKKDNDIESFWDFLSSYFALTAMGGAGNAGVSETTWGNYHSNIVELDIGDLGLLDFEIPEDSDVIESNKTITEEYFGIK